MNERSSPVTEVLDFLNSIEGAGYGGMASFEIARAHVQDMLATPTATGDDDGVLLLDYDDVALCAEVERRGYIIIEAATWGDAVAGDALDMQALYAGAAQQERDPFDTCVMIVEEECILDKPPARDDTYERAMHEIGLAIRDRIRCAQRNPDAAQASCHGIMTERVVPPDSDLKWVAYYHNRNADQCGTGEDEKQAVQDLIDNYDRPPLSSTNCAGGK